MAKYPKFDGQPVVNGRLGVAGATLDADSPLHLGDKVWLLVEGTVAGVEHRNINGLLTRHHKVGVDEAMFCPDEIMPEVKAAIADAIDARDGQSRLTDAQRDERFDALVPEMRPSERAMADLAADEGPE